MNNTIIITNTNYTITTATTISNSSRIQYLVCDLGTTVALLWLRVGSRMSKLRVGRQHSLSANNYISFLYTQQMIAIVKPRLHSTWCNVFQKLARYHPVQMPQVFLCLL